MNPQDSRDSELIKILNPTQLFPTPNADVRAFTTTPHSQAQSYTELTPTEFYKLILAADMGVELLRPREQPALEPVLTPPRNDRRTHHEEHRKKLAAVAFTFCAVDVAGIRRQGRQRRRDSKAPSSSGSVDAIIAEVERAESLMCEECMPTMINLTEDNRVEVREVAAWWFAKRPALQRHHGLADQGRARRAADSIARAQRG